jgi:hypothetical protein
MKTESFTDQGKEFNPSGFQTHIGKGGGRGQSQPQVGKAGCCSIHLYTQANQG